MSFFIDVLSLQKFCVLSHYTLVFLDVLSIYSFCYVRCFVVIIDGHACWNSKHWLPCIVCWPRKTKFRFLFPFSVCSKQRELLFSVSSIFCIFVNIYTDIYNIYLHQYIYMKNGRPCDFSLIRFLFAHLANRSLSLFRLLMKKQTEVIHLQTD
jgi:hypothetical protein